MHASSPINGNVGIICGERVQNAMSGRGGQGASE